MMGSLQELLSQAYELICNAEVTGLVSTESIRAPRADGGGSAADRVLESTLCRW